MSEEQLEYPEGELIFCEGDVGRELYVIASGKVQIYHDSAGGPIVIATLGPGEFFGEMALVDHQPRSASAVTLVATNLLKYQPASIRELIEDRPGIAERIIKIMAQRLRKTDEAFRQAILDLRRY